MALLAHRINKRSGVSWFRARTNGRGNGFCCGKGFVPLDVAHSIAAKDLVKGVPRDRCASALVREIRHPWAQNGGPSEHAKIARSPIIPRCSRSVVLVAETCPQRCHTHHSTWISSRVDWSNLRFPPRAMEWNRMEETAAHRNLQEYLGVQAVRQTPRKQMCYGRYWMPWFKLLKHTPSFFSVCQRNTKLLGTQVPVLKKGGEGCQD